MANPDHLAILQDALAKNDITIWNAWCEYQRQTRDMYNPDLRRADLRRAKLHGADLVGVRLDQADFRGAAVQRVNLRGASLRDANLTGVFASKTNFAQIDLSSVRGLETIYHISPSTIGVDTLYLSKGKIPEVFLRGCGVPETMITFAKSLISQAIEYYSAFISFSYKDKLFAHRLHNDLLMNGVRVWFAPEDLKIGAPIEDSIDQAIRVYDKFIIVLSENSIERAWVRKEFAKAIEKEKQHGKTVLFPIRLDDSVFETSEQWAYDIRKRHIGDFRNWLNPLLYQNAINRLLKNLNAG